MPDPVFITNKSDEVLLGNQSGQTGVNKFGRSTDVDSGVATDIWDRANSTHNQVIWVPPTQARTHQIASTSDLDGKTASPNSVGARTIQVYGLTSWSTKEVSEVITLNGTSNVATANQYVIIHRMKVLTKGATNINVGYITATADTDTTVTAQINPSEGQTQMAIYGIPSNQTALMTCYYSSAIKAASSLSVKISLLLNPNPDAELLNFQVKSTVGLATEGANYVSRCFHPYFKITGSAIIKIQGDASSNNTDVSAGFDMLLIDN